jgi:hypothetical protein
VVNPFLGTQKLYFIAFILNMCVGHVKSSQGLGFFQFTIINIGKSLKLGHHLTIISLMLVVLQVEGVILSIWVAK